MCNKITIYLRCTLRGANIKKKIELFIFSFHKFHFCCCDVHLCGHTKVFLFFSVWVSQISLIFFVTLKQLHSQFSWTTLCVKTIFLLSTIFSKKNKKKKNHLEKRLKCYTYSKASHIWWLKSICLWILKDSF